MTQREDLLSICRMLAVSDEIDLHNSSDHELLKAIIRHLDQIEGTESNVLKRNSIDNSLAFPDDSKIHSSRVSNEGWNWLKECNDLFRQDFTIRRKMMLTRLDCTVESFKWKGSDHGSASPSHDQSSLNEHIHSKYDLARKNLRPDTDVTFSRLLAIRQGQCNNLLNCVVSSRNADCLINYRTSKKNENEKNLVNLKRVIIPDVPDRGGRTGEIRAPVRETFDQQFKNRRRGRGGRR